MNSNSQSHIKPILLIGIVSSLAMLAVSAYAWSQIPPDSKIPIHWNAAGEVDGYTSQAVGLLLLPALSMGMFCLLALTVKIELRKLNLEQSAKAFTSTAIGLGTLLLFIHITIVAVALGNKVDVVTVITGAVGVLLMVIGNVMGKVRSNYVFGVRTPWTLSSELSWNKTNRLAGKLLMTLGLLILILAFMGTTGMLLICALIGLLVAIAAWSFIYSYLVWRDDPETQQA